LIAERNHERSIKKLMRSSCPEYEALRNCVYYYRKTRLTAIIEKSKADFDSWIQAHSNPGNEDSCYVLSHHIDSDKFLLALSSRRLLQNALVQSKYASSLLFVDTTYKIINSGLLLMVVGTQTLEHQFRPIAFSNFAQRRYRSLYKVFRRSKERARVNDGARNFMGT
jgi:hypothetical protein